MVSIRIRSPFLACYKLDNLFLSRAFLMSLASFLSEIGCPFTKLHVGGFRPTNSTDESWLGKVTQYMREEELPDDKDGNSMFQLGQFYLPPIKNVHPSLASV